LSAKDSKLTLLITQMFSSGRRFSCRIKADQG
jgi:hypothetical protein